jgi:hypothetical protein
LQAHANRSKKGKPQIIKDIEVCENHRLVLSERMSHPPLGEIGKYRRWDPDTVPLVRVKRSELERAGEASDREGVSQKNLNTKAELEH